MYMKIDLSSQFLKDINILVESIGKSISDKCIIYLKDIFNSKKFIVS